MPHSGVVIGHMKEKFAEGRRVHEPTREFLVHFLRDFAVWIERVSCGREAEPHHHWREDGGERRIHAVLAAAPWLASALREVTL